MKGIQLILKIKKHELYELQREHKSLELEISSIEDQIELLNCKLKTINFLNSKSIVEYKQKLLFVDFLIKEIDSFKEKKRTLLRKLEIKKEELSRKKAELEMIKKLREKRVREREKYEEIQTERFLNEVHNSRSCR